MASPSLPAVEALDAVAVDATLAGLERGTAGEEVLGPAAGVLEVAPRLFLGLLDEEAGEGRDCEGVEEGGALPKKAKRDCWPLGGSFFCDDMFCSLISGCTR